MTAGGFDYKRAWEELAEPAFNCQAANIRGLYEETCKKCRNLPQQSSLDLPWPCADGDPKGGCDEEFRRRFYDLPSELLAEASRVIYFYGHWAPTGKTIAHEGYGGYWRFSNYADQVLRRKCGLLPRGPLAHDHGLHYEIHQGFLRACLSTPWSWRWWEIGLGTETGLKKARGLNWPQRKSRRRWRSVWEAYELDVEEFMQVVDLCGVLYPKSGFVREFFATERFRTK